MRATKKDIKQAINYLIRISQLDNYDIQLKATLAKGVNCRDLDVLAEEMHRNHFSGNFNIDEIFKGSYIEVRPKSVDTAIASGSHAANSPPVLSKFVDYMYYFRLSFLAQVCEVIWIMKYGKLIDDTVADCAYANRLSLDGEYLFKHYWTQYRRWRDQGFSDILLTSTKTRKSIISFDIAKCYNSIRVKNLDKTKSTIFPMHIWRKYDSMIEKYNRSLLGSLPVGPLSSGIYANQILSEYDSQIEKMNGVLYYGRYVDDILIVCDADKSRKSPLDRFAISAGETYTISSNENVFAFNKEKTRVYDYDLAHPLNTFAVFKMLIEDNSSEWRLAPDLEISEIQFSKAISSINAEHSVNKPKSFSEIKIDRKELKNNLTKHLVELSAIDKLSKSESEELIRGLCFAFSGGNAIKYHELWPTLFSVLRFLETGENAILKIANGIIENLNLQESDISQKDCIGFLKSNIIVSYIYASTNARSRVNRDTFGELKKISASGIKTHVSERSIKQLLHLKLDRPLLFNKAKSFKECVEQFNIEVAECRVSDIDSLENYEIEAEEISFDEQELGKRSKINIALAHVKVSKLLIEDSIKGVRKTTKNDLTKIIRPINSAVLSNAHILCFPEVSLPERLLSLVITYAKLKGITIIAGVEHCIYDGVIGNFIVHIQPTKFGVDIFARPKIHYAPGELELLRKAKVAKLVTTNKFPIISYRNTSIAVFNCFELADIKLRSLIKGRTDAIFGIEFNYDIKYFSNIMESLCRDNHAYCIQSNAGQIGENRIIAPVESHHADLIRFKAGLDPMAITTNIDIYSLQKFHTDSSTYYDRINKIEFRKLPPGFKSR